MLYFNKCAFILLITFLRTHVHYIYNSTVPYVIVYHYIHTYRGRHAGARTLIHILSRHEILHLSARPSSNV